MILDVLLGLPIGIGAELLLLLPEATGAPMTFDLSGLTDAVGLALLFNEGVPIEETLPLLGGYFAASLVIDGFVLLRAMVRWLPSWLTGGG